LVRLTVAAALVTLFALVGTPTYGQTVGLSAGGNIAKITESACQVTNEPCDLDYKPGFTVGVFVPLGWGDSKPFGLGNGKYAIQPELRFARKGGKTSQGGLAVNHGQKVNTIEFAALGRVNVEVGN